MHQLSPVCITPSLACALSGVGRFLPEHPCSGGRFFQSVTGL